MSDTTDTAAAAAAAPVPGAATAPASASTGVKRGAENPDAGEPAAKRPRSHSSSEIPEENLLLAVPKKGRLYERICKLLDGIGVRYRRRNRLDIAHSTNMNITLVFLPAHDIASYVGSGNVDLGITGEDIIAETLDDPSLVNVELPLDMGKCRLCLLAPADQCARAPATFAESRIVTSFPNLTRKFFSGLAQAAGHKPRVRYVSGSVEAACGLGLADAVVDLVETGTTMRAAGLDVVHTIMHTQTVLIANTKTKHSELIAQLRSRIDGWLTAQKYSMLMYNVSDENLQQARTITPGISGPTVMPIANGADGWSAVTSMVKSKELPRTMDQLQAIGATGIVALQLNNCRI